MIREPRPKTLSRYGLSLDDWKAILARQEGLCAVCKRAPKSGRLCIDHEHLPGWKKLPPNERKRYVRGLLCWFDNHYRLARGITPDLSRNVTQYLEQYELRKSLNGEHSWL